MKTHLNLPPLTEKQLEVVNGSLLGDGTLHGNHKVSHWNWSFIKSQSKLDKCGIDKKDYIKFHFNSLSPYSSNIGFKTTKNTDPVFTLKKPEYYSYVFSTHVHPVWTEMSKKWYLRDTFDNLVFNKINRIIKIIPRDLKLTPLTACIWFMDDGFNYSKDGNASIATNGFSVEDVKFLIDRLQQDLGIYSTLRFESRAKQPFIFIGVKSWRDFIEIIKPHVKWSCFQYKLDTNYTKVHQSGSNHWKAKLTDDDVREIFKLYNEGWKQKDINKKFSIDYVNMILNGKLWKHLRLPLKPKSNMMKPHLNKEQLKEQKEKAFILKKEGLSQKAIGKELGIHQATVSRMLKENK